MGACLNACTPNSPCLNCVLRLRLDHDGYVEHQPSHWPNDRRSAGAGAGVSRLRALRRVLAAVFAPRARWRPRGPGSRSLVGRILAINMITLLIPVIGSIPTAIASC